MSKILEMHWMDLQCRVVFGSPVRLSTGCGPSVRPEAGPGVQTEIFHDIRQLLATNVGIVLLTNTKTTKISVLILPLHGIANVRESVRK
jgi:hypothetical protein